MRFKTSLRATAGVVLAALLFAQAALAVAACDWLRVAPALAITANADEPSCHEAPTRNPNLCLAHCLGNDQSADTPQVIVPEWNKAVLVAVVDAERAPAREALLIYTLPRPGAPPPRILFQTFLI